MNNKMTKILLKQRIETLIYKAKTKLTKGASNETKDYNTILESLMSLRRAIESGNIDIEMAESKLTKIETKMVAKKPLAKEYDLDKYAR